MTNILSKIEGDIVGVAKKVKDGIEDAGEDALKLANFVQKNSTEIAALAGLAGSKGSNVETVSMSVLSQVIAAVKDAGAAAGASALNVSFDQTVIADVKALIKDIESIK